MGSSMLFPTFFHINDYRESGYAALPRLIATSSPLVLWAPSGRLLEQCYQDPDNPCTISPTQFLQLIEAGHIHILGREEWFDKPFRNRHEWPGARWMDSTIEY